MTTTATRATHWLIEQAVARVEVANTEGDPILSAWLGVAKRFLESVVDDPRLV